MGLFGRKNTQLSEAQILRKSMLGTIKIKSARLLILSNRI